MTLGWGTRRKLLYSAVVIVVGIAVLAFIYQSLFTAPPTCFDRKQNGTETGVDCGGSCSLVCPDSARAPAVLWARSFETDPGTYTAAAYIQNRNVGAGARRVAYSFKLFDAQNSLVVERDGVADLPPLATIPIVEPGIRAGNRVVARTLFAFLSVPVWSKISSASLPNIHVADERLAEDGSQLSAMVENNSAIDTTSLTAVGVLFDADGAALAASKSALGVIAGKSSGSLVFTWPLGTPNAVRAEIIILPSF